MQRPRQAGIYVTLPFVQVVGTKIPSAKRIWKSLSLREKDARSSDEIQSGGSKIGSGEPWVGLNSSLGKPTEMNRKNREAWVVSEGARLGVAPVSICDFVQ